MAFQQSTAVPIVSTSKKEIEYNWFNLFHSTGSGASFFPTLLTFGPSNSCSEKKSHTICMAKFLFLFIDLNCSEGGYPLKFPPLMAITLENKQLSIQELIFMTKSF